MDVRAGRLRNKQLVLKIKQTYLLTLEENLLTVNRQFEEGKRL